MGDHDPHPWGAMTHVQGCLHPIALKNRAPKLREGGPNPPPQPEGGIRGQCGVLEGQPPRDKEGEAEELVGPIITGLINNDCVDCCRGTWHNDVAIATAR